MGLVGDVAVWWAGQMRDLLPGGVTRNEDRSDAVLVEPGAGGTSLSLSRRRRGRETPLGEVPTDAAGAAAARRLVGAGRRTPRVLVRVAADAVLERPVSLPLATERDLDRVLAYELDRYVPFAADEVFWTYALDRRDPVAGQLHLRLAVLPRAGLQGVLDALRAAGLPAAGLVAPRPGGPAWTFGFEAPGVAAVAGGRRRALALATAACALLALVAVALPFVQQGRALSAAEARIATARPAIAEVEALRRRIAERAGGNDAVATEAARLGRPLEALAALTTILPDDTHLTALTLRHGVATLTGQSGGQPGAAARLVAAVSAHPSVRVAAFAAPVTRQEGGRGEAFTIRVEFGS